MKFHENETLKKKAHNTHGSSSKREVRVRGKEKWKKCVESSQRNQQLNNWFNFFFFLFFLCAKVREALQGSLHTLKKQQIVEEIICDVDRELLVVVVVVVFTSCYRKYFREFLIILDSISSNNMRKTKKF